MSDDVKVDQSIFKLHLNKLVNAWKNGKSAEDGLFGGADAIAVVLGKTKDVEQVFKSQALHIWLLGYEFSETIIVFTKSKMIILTGSKKAIYLKPLQSMDLSLQIEIIERQKSDNQSDKLNELITAVKAANKDIKTLGALTSEKWGESTLNTEFYKLIKDAGINLVDISEGLAHVFSIKDEDELVAVQNAAEATTVVLSSIVTERLEQIIDESIKIKHSDFSKEIEDAVGNPKIMKSKVKLPEHIKFDHLELTYPPIIQSGGSYDFKRGALSSDQITQFDTILLQLSFRYRSYSSNIARTILISPEKEQEENYKLILELRGHVTKMMREGVKLSEVYVAARTFIEQKKASLLEHFGKDIGHSMGIEFREKQYVLDDKCQNKMRVGMVFNLSLGLKDLKYTTRSGVEKTYALLLADTVIITSEGFKILTSKHSAKPANISYTLEDDDGKADATASSSSKTRNDPDAMDVDILTERRSRRNNKSDSSEEKQRTEQQQKLLDLRIQEGLKRFSKDKEQKTEAEVARKLEAYKTPDHLPRDLKFKINLDDKRDCIILPVFGLPVPFHIATIKQTKRQEQDGNTVLHIHFSKPNETLAVTTLAPEIASKPYLRQITLRSVEQGHLQSVQTKINQLRKSFLEREKQQKEQDSMIEQGALELSRDRPQRLRDVLIRPLVGDNKRAAGDLELHMNGLRYTSVTGKKIDILFGNIKHLIYQQSEGEFITLLHFNFKNPIMVNNKKLTDIQFYREVVSAMADEAGRRASNAYDKDEIEQEQREREERKRHDKEFKAFGKLIAERSNGKIELDRPLDAIKGEDKPNFYGTPHRSTVLLRPTLHALVQLVEIPFTLISMNDVEVAVCERVQPGVTKSFDLVFINKNLKDFSHVNSINIDELSKVQKWLTNVDIPYLEYVINANWGEVLKEINTDALGFYRDGGWQHAMDDLNSALSDDEDENPAQNDDDDGKGDGKGKKPSGSDESDPDFEGDDDDDEEYESDASAEYADSNASDGDADGDDDEEPQSDIANSDDEDEEDEDEEERASNKKSNARTHSHANGGSDDEAQAKKKKKK